MKSKLPLVLTAVATVAFGSGSALAAPYYFNFNLTGSVVTASGTFTAASTGTAGEYLITGVTGVIDGFTITGLDAVGTYDVSSLPDNDNMLFYPAGSAGFFDDGGLSFQANGVDYNIFSAAAAGASYQMIDGPNGNLLEANLTNVQISPTSLAPEPSSLVLLGTGALGLVGAVRRRITA
jgi:hypothetical protein